jgi:hypothetical protein
VDILHERFEMKRINHQEAYMLIADRDAYVRAATGAMLTGKPFETLVDAPKSRRRRS